MNGTNVKVLTINTHDWYINKGKTASDDEKSGGGGGRAKMVAALILIQAAGSTGQSGGRGKD